MADTVCPVCRKPMDSDYSLVSHLCEKHENYPPLERLQRSSFFVYLSHCLFLTLATAYLQGLGVNRLSLLLAARLLVCYTVPFLLYALYQRTFGRCRPLRGLLG